MNYGAPKVPEIGRLVLIDTWWNVNFDSQYEFFFATLVLIDTWWNVNVRVLVRLMLES